jgi:tetratricopeptide (TPR) repeat protein
MLTMARFGLWDPILAEPKPAETEIYLVGIWHYVRGLAKAHMGSIQDAERELADLQAAGRTERARELLLAGGTANAAQLLAIGIAHLEGEIAIAEGRFEDAVAPLERAVQLHDALAYMEPPPWYAPPRQTLGLVLLELDRPNEAEAVYLEDLRQYPKNGWSLLGLTQSLEAQGEDAKAQWARAGFEQAWSRADVRLERSRL